MDITSHLIGRGLDPKDYKCYVDSYENIVTFLLYNLSGQIVGYQRYNPSKDKKRNNDPVDCRYYTYLPKEVDGLFGLDKINKNIKEIYVVEGIFKAAKLHKLGYNAIAVLTSTPKRLKTLIRILRAIYNIIAIGDNDNGGNQLIKIVGKGFNSPIDLDEMMDYDIVEMIEKFKKE